MPPSRRQLRLFPVTLRISLYGPALICGHINGLAKSLAVLQIRSGAGLCDARSDQLWFSLRLSQFCGFRQLPKRWRHCRSVRALLDRRTSAQAFVARRAPVSRSAHAPPGIDPFTLARELTIKPPRRRRPRTNRARSRWPNRRTAATFVGTQATGARPSAFPGSSIGCN